MSGWFSIISWPVFPFPMKFNWKFVWNQLTIYECIYFWILYFDPLIYMSALYQYQTPLLLYYYIFVILKPDEVSSPTWFFLNNSRGFSRFFVFTSEFENQLTFSTKKRKSLLEICSVFVDQFVENCSLNNIKFSNPWTWHISLLFWFFL